MKKSSTKTTAENFEARFDAGKDVLDYFDLTRVTVTHGGSRAGAGRPKLGKQRKTVKLSSQTIQRLEEFGRRNGLPNFSAAIEAAAEKVS
jgi:hypothetical protein